MLEGEEFEQAEVNRRVEPEATLVQPDRTVHLDSVAAIDLDLVLVVDPAHPEHDHSLWLDEALEHLHLPVLGESLDDGLERGQDLTGRLQKFRLAPVA